MLFNSLEFGIFLPIVFLLYWYAFQSNLKLQNAFVLAASYFFYGWWDWRFLILIFISSLADYTIGSLLGKSKEKKQRKFLLFGSFVVNIGLLGFFKYYNFFIESFVELSQSLGLQANLNTLKLILPVGISFYTFQTLSYTIDVYRKNLEPAKDIISFFAFVSFFPQLVAGPIERASNLLPQFYLKREFNYENAKDGLRQILWGLGKKVIIADTCAFFVNDIFQNYDTMPSSHLILGAVFFAFQIYGDFSGYSDVAIGTAKLFGFNLMTNFKTPYFSRDIAEFWRRWHISLSTWFRDYLYIPLGGSRVGGNFLKLRNVFAIFLVSGFWHGANWTFLFWGFLNALYFIPQMILRNNRRYLDIAGANKLLPSFKEFYQISITFGLTCLAWIFFRAESIGQGFGYIQNIIFNETHISVPNTKMLYCCLLVLGFVLVEWFQRKKEHGLELNRFPVPIRWASYSLISFFVLDGVMGGSEEFIYFQF